MLEWLTALRPSTMLRSLKATIVVRNRIIYGEELFAEIVVWLLSEPLAGSTHTYKYCLAIVAHGGVFSGTTTKPGRGITAVRAALKRDIGFQHWTNCSQTSNSTSGGT